MTWAAPDYEPTADEIMEFLADWRNEERTPGSHGSLRIVPTFEPYLQNLDGIFWGGRRVLADGTVELQWYRPPPCPNDHGSHEPTDELPG